MRAILDLPAIYELWQAPFAKQKLAPFRSRVDPAQVGKVIDLGCGPGTNASIFAPAQYLGIDISPSYIEHARRKHPHRFEVWDITEARSDLGDFDLALVNSVFHHLSDDETSAVLGALSRYLRPHAAVHIVDLILPPQRSLSRLLAQWDRGMHPRSLEAWQELIGRHLKIEFCQPFSVGLAGIAMWELVYIEGAVA